MHIDKSLLCCNWVGTLKKKKNLPLCLSSSLPPTSLSAFHSSLLSSLSSPLPSTLIHNLPFLS